MIKLLQKKIHKKILKKFNLVFYSKKENLNLLPKSDLSSFIKNEEIKSEFRYIKFLFLRSNLIFILKKYN